MTDARRIMMTRDAEECSKLVLAACSLTRTPSHTRTSRHRRHALLMYLLHSAARLLAPPHPAPSQQKSLLRGVPFRPASTRTEERLPLVGQNLKQIVGSCGILYQITCGSLLLSVFLPVLLPLTFPERQRVSPPHQPLAAQHSLRLRRQVFSHPPLSRLWYV